MKNSFGRLYFVAVFRGRTNKKREWGLFPRGNINVYTGVVKGKMKGPTEIKPSGIT
jgi:hypothetical protein